MNPKTKTLLAIVSGFILGIATNSEIQRNTEPVQAPVEKPRVSITVEEYSQLWNASDMGHDNKEEVDANLVLSKAIAGVKENENVQIKAIYQRFYYNRIQGTIEERAKVASYLTLATCIDSFPVIDGVKYYPSNDQSAIMEMYNYFLAQGIGKESSGLLTIIACMNHRDALRVYEKYSSIRDSQPEIPLGRTPEEKDRTSITLTLAELLKNN